MLERRNHEQLDVRQTDSALAQRRADHVDADTGTAATAPPSGALADK
jgi:hypothetical protein